MRPRTQYVDSGGYSIAYQVIGDGPVDVFFSKACCRISTCNGAIRSSPRPESARLVFTPDRSGTATGARRPSSVPRPVPNGSRD